MYILVIVLFFNDTATTEIYTLSLHDALPIWGGDDPGGGGGGGTTTATVTGRVVDGVTGTGVPGATVTFAGQTDVTGRSEEHTSELQSRQYLVCRLLLEKKKKTQEQSNIPM